MTAVTDEEIMFGLIDQVRKAAAGGSERNVMTFITRPMWIAFLRAIKHPDLNTLPMPGLTVFGSRTLLFNRPQFWSMSFLVPDNALSLPVRNRWLERSLRKHTDMTQPTTTRPTGQRFLGLAC